MKDLVSLEHSKRDRLAHKCKCGTTEPNGKFCDCGIPKKRCFPSDSQIQLQNGKIVTMEKLKVGDKVQTGRYSFVTGYNQWDFCISEVCIASDVHSYYNYKSLKIC